MILPDSTWFLADTTKKKNQSRFRTMGAKVWYKPIKKHRKNISSVLCSFVSLYYSLKNWLEHKNVDAQNCYL